MTSVDVSRFMVARALVPDLYFPGCSSAETLSKEANLTRTAVRREITSHFLHADFWPVARQI